MSLLKGKVTFRRFVPDKPPPESSRATIELLENDRFRGRLEDARKEEHSVWVTIHNLLDTDFSVANTYFPPYLLFALRTDRKAIAPALLRALVDRKAAELMRDTGLERLPPGGRAEIRDEIEEHYLPRILPTVTLVEVCWNLVSGDVWLASSSERAIGRVRKQFSATFSRALYPVTPSRLSLSDPRVEGRMERLVVCSATELRMGPGGGS